MWLCKCDCGNYVTVNSYALRTGHTRSCGCYMQERVREANKKHGLNKSRIYRTYYNIKNRCTNPHYYLFHRYGGRGITLCREWSGENGFENFYKWSMENGYRSGLSIERINNDMGYSPLNCKWATMKEQQNNRSTNRRVTAAGQTKTMAQWADILKVPYSTIQSKTMRGKAEEFIEGLLYASS